MSVEHVNYSSAKLPTSSSQFSFFFCDVLFVCVIAGLCLLACASVYVIGKEADEEASDILTDRWRLIQLIYYPRGECHSEIGLH